MLTYVYYDSSHAEKKTQTTFDRIGYSRRYGNPCQYEIQNATVLSPHAREPNEDQVTLITVYVLHVPNIFHLLSSLPQIIRHRETPGQISIVHLSLPQMMQHFQLWQVI